MQFSLFDQRESRLVARCEAPPPLLKWVGSKHRFAGEIVSYFPEEFGTYFEPFLGSGAVLGALPQHRRIGTDSFRALMDIWLTLRHSPDTLKRWYAERWRAMMSGDKVESYVKIRASYNAGPNAADLLFLCRSCYGGVVRFRQLDGYMSTPCGVHTPISPEAFGRRVDEWYRRTMTAEFMHMLYEEAMEMPKPGDLVYCDPPYSHSQSILYRAQSFSLDMLLKLIATCKSRGVYVALSIDGTKRSGNVICDVQIPDGLFEREILVNCGRSMLKRFQMNGRTLDHEVVADRLLLTF